MKTPDLGTSLVAQWLGVCLPMQGHGFEPWSGRIPRVVEQLACAPQLLSLCSRAHKPQQLSPRVPQLLTPTCLEPVLCNKDKPPL